MCCDAEDSKKNFYDSEMNQLIDQYTNSILLNITIPPPPRRKTRVADEGMVRGVGGGRWEVGGGKGWSVRECEQGWQLMISMSCLYAHFHTILYTSPHIRTLTLHTPHTSHTGTIMESSVDSPAGGQQTGSSAPQQSSSSAPQQSSSSAPQQSSSSAPQQSSSSAPQQSSSSAPQQSSSSAPQQTSSSAPQQTSGSAPQQTSGNAPQQQSAEGSGVSLEGDAMRQGSSSERHVSPTLSSQDQMNSDETAQENRTTEGGQQEREGEERQPGGAEGSLVEEDRSMTEERPLQRGKTHLKA